MNTQSRKTGAEAQVSQAPAEADFVGLVKYISEREKGLSKYSDKLRTSLQRIFNIFGDSVNCQVCDYSAPAEIHKSHAFVPKIQVSISVQDSEYFARETGEIDVYYLCIAQSKMLIQNQYGNMHDACTAPRWLLKQLVLSNRLPKFLQLVAQRLQEVEEEYAQVSQIAERMAQAILE